MLLYARPHTLQNMPFSYTGSKAGIAFKVAALFVTGFR